MQKFKMRIFQDTCFVVWIIYLFPVMTAVSAPGTTIESVRIKVDCRRDLAGMMVRGCQRISPVATGSDGISALQIAGQTASGWSADNPLWDSGSLEDGWYDAVLSEGGREVAARIAVLNSPEVMVHGGTISSNEVWRAGPVHLICHWVRIPSGKILTIEAGAIVKFCLDTGFLVDGVLNADKALFTASADDTAGGDTDMDHGQNMPECGNLQIRVRDGVLNLADCRQRYDSQMAFRMDILPGWNLSALPPGILVPEVENTLKKMHPLEISGSHFQNMQFPPRRGAVFWIYSSEKVSLDCRYSEKMLNSDSGLPDQFFGYIGVPGLDYMTLDPGSVEKIWQWKDDCYQLLSPETGGLFRLQPGKGYVIQKAPTANVENGGRHE